MKFFLVSVFYCVFLVFVHSFPLEENAEFEVHDDGGEIRGTGDELMSLARNKRHFNFPLPRPNFSGNWMGGFAALGAQVNYNVSLDGVSVTANYDFAPDGETRAGDEGRINLVEDKTQTLTLSAGHSRNIGPEPKMSENTIEFSYSKSF